jgi:hypothetical protein
VDRWLMKPIALEKLRDVLTEMLWDHPQRRLARGA